MKVSRSNLSNKEKTHMKRTLLVLAAAVLFLNTLVIPTVAHADGVPGGTSCGGQMCKP
jgi:hypothetical protein